MPKRWLDCRRYLSGERIDSLSAEGALRFGGRPPKPASLAKKGLLTLLLVFLLFLLVTEGVHMATLLLVLLVLLLLAIYEDVSALLLILLILLFLTGERRSAEGNCHRDCHDCHQHALHNMSPPWLLNVCLSIGTIGRVSKLSAHCQQTAKTLNIIHLQKILVVITDAAPI